MSNQGHKSNKFDTVEELVMMRMSIRAIRDRMNADLDAMAEQLDRMLPPEDEERHRRYKNFTPADWGDFLDGKYREIS